MAKTRTDVAEEQRIEQDAQHLAATYEYWILKRGRQHRYFLVCVWKTLRAMRRHLGNKSFGCMVHYPRVTLKSTRRTRKIGEIHLCKPHLQADVVCHEIGHAVRLYARLCRLKNTGRSDRDEERFCSVLGDMCIAILREAARLVPERTLLAWKVRRS